MKNLHSWNYFYTTAGRDSRDKFQVWLGIIPKKYHFFLLLPYDIADVQCRFYIWCLKPIFGSLILRHVDQASLLIFYRRHIYDSIATVG